MLVDNERKAVVRSIPITGYIPVVSDMKFSTNGNSFIITSNFEKKMCFDTSGTRIADFIIPETVAAESPRVRVVENSKGTPSQEWGVYCRDDTGRKHRLHDEGRAVTLWSRATTDTWLWG